MKTRVSAVTVTICGVRPVSVVYHKDIDKWHMSSPPCERSTFYPDAVSQDYNTVIGALQWSRQLISPLVDDPLGELGFRNNPRLEIVGVRFQVFDSSSEPLAVVDATFNGLPVPTSCRVSVPAIEVIEYFQSLQSALNFCEYLCNPLVLNIDTEANEESR